MSSKVHEDAHLFTQRVWISLCLSRGVTGGEYLWEVLHVAGVEMQLTAAVSFLTILHEESVSIHTYAHSFLQIILLHLEHRDAGVSNAWLETLLSVIEVLPKETLRHEILNPLVSKAQLSQTVQSRLVSCKILGKLTNKFDAHTIKREILPLVKSLCQDVEYEVRSCMCRQLENIAQGIGTDLTKSVVLPELIELSRDEGCSVRLAAFETLVNLLDIFDTDDRSQTILPLVKSFCEKSFKADESILISLSFHLGKLCHGLYGIFTPDQHLRFLEFYKKLCTLGLQQENGHNENQIPPQILEQEKKYTSVRKNCAYNLPAMIVFVDPKNFQLELYSTFFCLCHDPEVPVRYTIAICFYEVSKLLNSGVYLIHKELITLLQDESLEVLDALIDHLPEILELMSTGGESSIQENKLPSLPDLIPALTAAEQRAAASLKWRTHEKLLQKYACLPHIISSDQIYYRFLQRMFTIMMTNTVLELDRMEMSMDAFQNKFYEKDLLDQEKEREELLLLEMEQLEKEKQQEGRPVNEKTFEKKRRDIKTPTALPKSIPIAVPGPSPSAPSTSKEIKKSKLIRSQSINNQAFHAKYGNLDKCASKTSTAAYTPSVSGLAKTSMISLTDDSFRTRNASSLPPSFSPNTPLPSTSRGTGNSVDPKSSGGKDPPPRKATLKSRKSNP
ncbi:PREDICTED: serine/threonine-protein phosphatase 4 regulatory subunit 4 isoform X5 [Myotis brandtii]|uniref:serine/threonine-protein phosphatase 4 regulatory subunit 4 isoform X5 n=1 Tax=Myotis brandtii TaxID=109478 RepID=UPI0007044073|nr:PREDICTED: serine/threonine-protein phosphatase 4 regulatory subunit 4 isoform X5 [Myotis brandtii]